MAVYQPIFLSLNDHPRRIVRSMDALVSKRTELQAVQKRYKRLIWVLLLGSLPFVCIDFFFGALGYPMLVFSLVTLVAWVVAFILGISLRRLSMVEYPPYFQLSRELLDVLRDDGRPERQFFGEIDLTGTRLDSKVAREVKDRMGRTVQYFRDDWLNLKVKLYDGNMLRLMAIRREKVRKGFYKRSAISGKMKFKPERFKGELSELRVRLTVNPLVYDIGSSPSLAAGRKIGIYYVTNLDVSQGIVNLTAVTNTNLNSESILAVLKQVYTLLKRKPA